MSPTDLRSALEALALPQSDFAKLANVTPRAVSLWLSGERKVPGPLIAYVQLLLSLPAGQRDAEYTRLGLGAATLKAGMYRFVYAVAPGYRGEATLVFDNGRIFGTDLGKSRYDGTYAANPKSGLVDLYVRIELRAGEKSAVGPAQPFDWILEARGELPARSETGEVTFTANVGGPIAASYEYLRPLPIK